MPHKLLGVPESKRSRAFLTNERAFITASMIIEGEDRAKAAKNRKQRQRKK